MMRRLWTRLFPRRCPICRTAVHRGSAGAVRGVGTWCCSQSHADTYERTLYEALNEFLCRHTARHGVYRPQLTAPTLDVAISGAPGVGQGQQSGCDQVAPLVAGALGHEPQTGARHPSLSKKTTRAIDAP
jgi:hypothetical protein